MLLDCAGKSLSLDKVAIMGILNVTPDSFFDGGHFLDLDKAISHGRAMADNGAGILDIGGESTRPGAKKISTSQELERVIPVIEALAKTVDIPISVDTSKPEVMREAVRAGAGMINDVNALQTPGAMEVVLESNVPVCLMHMQGSPESMQADPFYNDVVRDVMAFLDERANACVGAGINRSQLIIDPGFGFGKTAGHNIRLLQSLNRFKALGLPILAGLSRKSLIGKLLGLPADRRLSASLALAVMAVLNGANILRVHDVAETVDAVRMTEAVAFQNQTSNGVM